MTNEHLTLERDDDLAVVWMDQQGSRVNKLSPATLEAVSDAIDEIERDPSVRAVVFISRKPDTFIAGADLDVLSTMQAPEEARRLSEAGHALIHRVRALRQPTVAAIHGAAMGGGLEVTLACTYRVATEHEKTKLALPEVQLGLLPGGGGTQLLPRLVGVQQALDMMLTGKNIYPRKARRIGLVDALTYRHNLLSAAKQAARALADGSLKPSRDPQGLSDKLLEGNPVSRRIIYQQAEKRVRAETKGNYPAPFKIIDCVRTGMEHGLTAGLKAEAEAFASLVFTPESRSLVSLFFAKQQADKNPLEDEARNVRSIGVLGAGLMGAGIAEVSAEHEMDVVLKDQTLELAANGRRELWKSASRKVDKHIMSDFERDVLIERVTPVDAYERFEDVDLVIEAVPENLDLKRSILSDVEAVTSDDCIFASNTSSIPITEIAEGAERPELVIGMHYFSPVPKMPLLEVIKTDATPDWVLATAYATGLRQGKTVIVVNDGPGFYTTRILAVYMNEALLMLEEGADIGAVDEAMEAFGFPMGPFELFDLVGIDVGAKITEVMSRYLTDRDMNISPSARALVDAGFTGQKGGAGFYHHETDERGRNRKKGLNETIYAFFGGPDRSKMPTTAIQERLSLTMVNEAVYCLQDNVLQSPRDGDLGAVFGLGFPPFRGGPFRYIDQETAPAITARLNRLQMQYGERFSPADLLEERARTGASFYSE